MNHTKELISIFSKEIPAKNIVEGCNNEVYAPINEEEFAKAITTLSARDSSLISLFCAESFGKNKGFTLFYAFEKAGSEEIIILQRALKSNHANSIAEQFPSASWYEREIMDGFGVRFDDAFDKRRLFLHERYPDDFHPLLKSFKNEKVKMKSSVKPEDEYQFREVHGEGVYHIPVGPVHAGIIEPGHFRFSVIGETIFNLEVRMFWKHRGIEKLAEGKTPLECVRIAETISGDETVANAVAFSNAVEKISNINVPVRAWHLRTIFLELERIYSHLGDMAGMIIDIAYPVGASPFFILREEMFRQNDALTGSRFMKGIVAPSGLKKDIPEDALGNLSSYLEAFSGRFCEAIKVAHSSSFSVIDRLETTGVVRKDLIKPLHITGPVARASGALTDTRIDHPYGIYGNLGLSRKFLERGDVISRFDLKAAEVLDSVRIIRKMIKEMPKGSVIKAGDIADGYAISVVEAPRGQSVHWLYLKNGVVDRYKVRTASFCNWQAIEHAVLGNIVPDFPLINKSMNLSYAGTDL
ncbi:Membrane-bound hydrogenase subunit alpha [uncultured archaeon]|nr:Membrane-bound hydrogenase subunit alpha [uncultured archaeon]